MADDAARMILGRRAGMFGTHAPEPALSFNSGLSPLVDLAGSALLDKLFAGTGLLPGQLFPAQNLYDVWQSRAEYQAHQLAIQEGARVDQDTYRALFRGVARHAGLAPDPAAAATFARGVSAASPLLMQLLGPETFDALHGSRGSAAVLAQGLFRGGRLAVDPVTGETGLSVASTTALAEQLHSQLAANPRAFHGLSQGRLGLLYDALQAEGLAPGSLGTRPADDPLGALARDPAAVRHARDLLTARAPAAAGAFDDTALADPARGRDLLEQLQQHAPGDLGTVARHFDARQVESRLKNLSGAVAAMRDIFGDIGRPNAPMKELVEGLNQLTQGGLATLPAGRLQQSVRMTQSLAKLSGLGMDGMLGLAATGASLADQLGLRREFVPGASQGAAAFGLAFGQSGLGAHPHFQARDREAMTLLDQRLRLQAAHSGMANQLNTALRLADTVTQSGGTVGAPLQALTEALRRHETTFVDPRTGQATSVFQGEGAFRDLMKASGVSDAVLNQFAGQRESNLEFGHRFGTGDLVRNHAQAETVRTLAAQAHRASAAEALRSGGIRDPNDRLAGAMAAAAASALTGMDPEKRRDDAARNAAVAEAMQGVLARHGLAGKVPLEQLHLAAAGGFGAFNERIHQGRDTQGLGTGLAALESVDRRLLAGQERRTEEARVQARMRSALAGVARGGPVENLVNAILNDTPLSAGKLLGKVAGGVEPGEVPEKALAGIGPLRAELLPGRPGAKAEAGAGAPAPPAAPAAPEAGAGVPPAPADPAAAAAALVPRILARPPSATAADAAPAPPPTGAPDAKGAGPGKPAAASAEPAREMTMRIVGAVRIEGGMLHFDGARLEPAGPGFTPVAGSGGGGAPAAG